LEKENIEYRRRLDSQPIWSQLPPTPTVSIESGMSAITPVMSHGSTSPPAQILQINTMVSPPAEELDIKTPTSPTGTLGRVLEGIMVSGAVLDELYQTYA
jgi:hypothetical protein